jgi:hypothetical protein
MMDLTNDGKVYGIFQRFHGAAGATTYGGKAEGVWIRENDRILFSSHPGAQKYSAHPDLPWLDQRTHSGVSINLVAELGPYGVYAFAREPPEAVCLPQVTFDEGNIKAGQITIPLEGWSAFIRRPMSYLRTWFYAKFSFDVQEAPCSEGVMNIIYHAQTCATLSISGGVRAAHGNHVDALTARVESAFQSDPEMCAIRSIYPETYTNVVLGTVLFSLYSRKDVLSRYHASLRAAHAQSDERLAEARTVKTVGAKQQTRPPMWMAATALLFWLGVLLTRNAKTAGYLLAAGIIALISASEAGAQSYDITFDGRAPSIIPEGQFGSFIQAYASFDVPSECPVGYQLLPPGTTLGGHTTNMWDPSDGFKGNLRMALDGSGIDDLRSLTFPSSNRMYCLAITNGLLYMPANNPINLVASIRLRIHNDVHQGLDDPEIRRDRWAKLATLCVSYGFFAQLDCTVSVEECASFMSGPKRDRLLRANDAELVSAFARRPKTINLKWNETLGLKETTTGFDLKPRPITNVDPRYHSIMLPWARSLADHMHRVFDGSLFTIAGEQVSIWFASGATVTMLREMYTSLTSHANVLLVAGDDILLRIKGMYAEADMSACDHTQDGGPFFGAGCIYWKALGASVEMVEALTACITDSYVAHSKGVAIKGSAGIQMPTGIATTTTQTSLHIIMATVDYFRRVFEDNVGRHDLKAVFADLGLKAKVQFHDKLANATFLRGWWTTDVWVPLPSQLLKLGKVLTDPRTIAGTKDRAKAVRRVAYAIAASYKTIPRDYPLLGPFLGMLERLGEPFKAAADRVIESYAYKPQVGAFTLRESTVDAIMTRYSLNQCDLDRVKDLCASIPSLPIFLHDPVFKRLQEVDYA